MGLLKGECLSEVACRLMLKIEAKCAFQYLKGVQAFENSSKFLMLCRIFSGGSN